MSYRFVFGFILALSLSVLNSSAQEVFVGKANQFSSKNGKFDIVGKVKGITYVYRTTNYDYFLEGYNDSMRLLATIALDFFPKEVEKATFINYPDRILVLYSAEEKGKIILSGAVLDEKGMLVDKVKKLDEEKINWLSNKKNYYETIYSEDRSKLVVVSKGGNNDDKSFKLLTFSDDLTLLNNKKINIAKEDEADHIELSYAQVSNEGKVIIPAFNTTNRGSITDASVLIFQENDNRYTNVPLMEKKDFFADLILKIDNKNKICHIAALYKDGNSGNVDGTFSAQILLQAASLIKKQKNEFPEAFLKAFQVKSWKKGFNNAKLQQLIVKQDGGYILISENQLFTIRNQFSGGYMGYYMYYNGPMISNSAREYSFDDIAIMNYDKDGVLLWSEFVRKKQYSQEDEGVFSSYSFLNTGANLVMLFNNFGSKDNSIGIAAIDNQGKMQMTRLNQFVINMEWYMRGAKQIGNREILIPTFNRNEINFVKVNF